eukprot:TRINITY_DN2535_c0_g1_i2.p1 TRINITY_DN2535_c0_g1~~TRINITY_DN2535_c0_g1_i2.p1  ORF type:complete len:216 (+),score=39.38 TRINITY_DN2535_c0_g1_i2:562-1209(+)
MLARIAKILEAFRKTPEYLQVFLPIWEQLKPLGVCGAPDRISFLEVHNAISILQNHKLPVPPLLLTMKEQIHHAVTSVLAKDFKPEFLRLSVGRFVNDLLNQMRNKITGTVATKLAIFSAHEVSLAPLQVILGIYKYYPPMGSSMCFELYKEKGWTAKEGNNDAVKHYTVRVLRDREPVALPACGGKVFCPFEEFVGAMSRFAVDNHTYELECQL